MTGKGIMLLAFSPFPSDPQNSQRKPVHAMRPHVCFPCPDLVHVYPPNVLLVDLEDHLLPGTVFKT